jgi:hypothetical protein
MLRMHPMRFPLNNDSYSPPLLLGQPPGKYQSFANGALYYGYNTAKLGVAVGALCAAVMGTERLARWFYRNFRKSIQYWKEEVNDLKNNGMEPAFEKHRLANEAESWQSPVLEKRGRHIKWSTAY